MNYECLNSLYHKLKKNEPLHEISYNVVCANSKDSDQSLYKSLEYSMNIKLPTKHRLEFLSLKGGCTCVQAGLSLHMSKCHIGGNHMSQHDIMSGSDIIQQTTSG